MTTSTMTAGAAAAAAGGREDGRVEWRRVGAYLLLAFGLTWAVELAALAGGMRFDRPGGAQVALLTGVMFLPALSAYLVRRFITREGFATAGLRWGPWRLYLAVWLGVPLLFGAIYLLTAALGLADFDPSGQAAVEQLRALAGPAAEAQPLPAPAALLGSVLVATLTVGVLLTSIATFGEEFGWTGYLLPALLPLGRWRAALLYGALWGLWHAPIIWGGYNYPGHPLLGIGMMILFTTSIALLQTGLWLRSRSVALTSFLHAGINTQARGIWPLLFVGVSPLLGGAVGLVGIAVLAMAGAWLLRTAPAPGPPPSP